MAEIRRQDADVPDIAETTSVPETTNLDQHTETNIDLTLPDQNTTEETELEQEKPYLLPIYIYTAIFGAMFILGPLLVRRGPNASITRICIMMSVFCCWIFWTTTYIMQLNPLLGPRMGNETLAWIGYKWGKNPLDVRDVNETEDDTLIDDEPTDELDTVRTFNDTILLSNQTELLNN